MTDRFILPLALCLVLAGCASSAQLTQRDEERCVARGYQPNTEDFKKCLVLVETERKLKMDARHQEMLERSSAPWAR